MKNRKYSQNHSGIGDNVGGDKYVFSDKKRNFGQSISDFIFGLFLLIFKPKECFEVRNSNIRCKDYSGFEYWFYTFILFYGVILFSSKTSEHYSVWYFLSTVTYGILRIILVCSLFYLSSVLIGVKKPIMIVDSVLFATGTITFFSTILFIPFIFYYGFEVVNSMNLSNDISIMSKEEIKLFSPLMVGVVLLWLIVLYYLKYIYIVQLTSTKSNKAILIILLSVIAYNILRPFTVAPAIEILFKIYESPPW